MNQLLTTDILISLLSTMQWFGILFIVGYFLKFLPKSIWVIIAICGFSAIIKQFFVKSGLASIITIICGLGLIGYSCFIVDKK
jgi:hypothetical protein